MKITRRALVACSLLMLATPAFAANLSTPTGRVLLTVSGAISGHEGTDRALFDRGMLEQLDWVEIETHTSFTTGVQKFSGPTLASLIEAVQAEGGMIQATAINDYTVEFPVEDAARHNVILAMDHNGKPMRIRDKGPIWIVYPQSAKEAADQMFDAEMIWQLDRIVFK